MKVLVTCVPEPGHLNPLLPLIEALLAQGDRVVVATGIDPDGAIAKSGAEFFAAGHGIGDWFDAFRSRGRGVPGDGLDPERINYYFVPRLFAEIAACDMVDDVLACGRELRPDIVLFESYSFAGPLVADLLGVGGVHHLISPMLPHAVMELANDALSPLWRSFGTSCSAFGGIYNGTTIEVAPPSLEAQQVPGGRRLAMRPSPLPLQAAVEQPARPPIIYVTFGTFFNSNLELFRTTLAALGAEDLEIVVTVGRQQDPDALGEVPANTRVERFIPQAELLPRCSVVVHHGGSGTMFGALAHGLPQVVVPQGADNYLNAELLVRAGVAQSLSPMEMNPDSMRNAVHSALRDESYADAARALAKEIEDMLEPAEVARSLQASK